MELREALTQIAEIRQQMARGQIFRGYRAATTAFSGAAALIAGTLQTWVVPDPHKSPKHFVLLWGLAALVCLAAVALEMIFRTHRSRSPVQRQLTLLAVEQFMPSIVAGALLTYVFSDFLPEQLWLLPGLWMIIFSLGVFASARLLPRAVFGIGGFYLIAGILTLLLTHDDAMGFRFSPWIMAVPFAVGQFSTAGILYYKLERPHGG
jgi:hypothetical protein